MKQIILLSVIPFTFLSIDAQVTKVTGLEAMLIRMKSTCGTTEEGKTIYGMWEGRVYSRVPGEKDKHLFNVVGINVRQCDMENDKTRGMGFKSVSREIMVYIDPKTNKIMDVWKNPWTGEEMAVVHVANDPVNMRSWAWEKDEKGNNIAKTEYRKYGKIAMTSYEIPLFYDNPLGSDYQVYVGGAYHAMEIFNTSYNANEFTDAKIKNINQSNISWSRVAQWLPWMQMGSKSGVMIFNATGYSTFDEKEIWPVLKKAINERYPLYKKPPPLDDKRPNETSWIAFKKHMEGKKLLKVRDRH
ncbi:DUF1838 family protein [Aquimarina sp. RZ0]|uniref:DUF1838 family protein n=1 Tax=Aquimarina sp. RZ0 TaxID=2607730 RepID=UPI0011F292A1|nr:DUF1838 family protein [Aquimarina sp. RZ0]KAA1244934.1 DUF1838 domain-containing protein [Aquimarina sp. RZ0]